MEDAKWVELKESELPAARRAALGEKVDFEHELLCQPKETTVPKTKRFHEEGFSGYGRGERRGKGEGKRMTSLFWRDTVVDG